MVAFGAAVGIEWAGEVVETGSEVQGFKAGERVMCSGNAAMPNTRSAIGSRPSHSRRHELRAGAVLPVALATLHNALVTRAPQAGDSAMIQGASSGVGLMGLQIANSLAPSR